MKNTAYFLALGWLIFTACENTDDVDISRYVLSSDTQYIHAVDGTDSSSITSQYIYDRGKLTKIEFYSPESELPIGKQEYYYNENEQLLNSYSASYLNTDRDMYQEVFYSFVYNEQGKVASEIIDSLIYYVWPDTLRNIEQTDYEYDEQQRLVSIHTYYSHTNVDFGMYRFHYDSESNLIKEEYYSEADDMEPRYFIDFKSFDTHPNPFNTFVQITNIPYYEVGYRYSSNNVQEAVSFSMKNSQKNTTVYEYEYSTEHDFPVKIYTNGKIKHELTYEKLN